jgi:ribosomal RNA-processing protein 9
MTSKGVWNSPHTLHMDSCIQIALHDRTVKLSDLTPSVFGYRDTVWASGCGVRIRAETAVSVGARDKTIRFWKIVDETQLVFRGGEVG